MTNFCNQEATLCRRGPTRALLIDLDETLIDRAASWRGFAGRLPLAAGADVEGVLAAILAADEGGYRVKAELFAALARELPLAAATDGASLEALWRREFPSCCVARAGAHDLLATLRARGWRLAIVSNGRADMQSAKLTALGLDARVDAVAISGALGVKKPDPRIYAHALAAIGATAAEAIYVGDHPTLDVVGPMRVGLRAAWLRLGRTWPAELPPPTWTIDALADTLALG